jgi:hypothetical protein
MAEPEAMEGIMIRWTVTPLVILLVVGTASGAMMSNAKPEKVVPHAHVIVRGTVDHATDTVKVLKVYGGAPAPKHLTVVNLAKFGRAGSPFDDPKKRQKLEENWPTHAILCLARIDDRYWLVDTSSPSWVPAHASIKYVGAGGKLLGYHQQINPGPLNLVPEETTLAELEIGIERWWKERPAAPPMRKALEGDERKVFWALVTPWIDFYTGKVTRSPRPGKQLEETVGSFAKFVVGHEGEARNRGIEALLILARDHGNRIGPRRRAVQDALAGLAKKLPREALEPTLLAELGSPDIYAEREIAGKTLLRMGPESAKAGCGVLVRVYSTSDGSLATRAYWALKSMGFHEAAEKARRKKSGKK